MTFSDATKIIVMGSRRFRVVTVDLKDLPSYLKTNRREPYQYRYLPLAYDEVLITRREEIEHEHSDSE